MNNWGKFFIRYLFNLQVAFNTRYYNILFKILHTLFSAYRSVPIYHTTPNLFTPVMFTLNLPLFPMLFFRVQYLFKLVFILSLFLLACNIDAIVSLFTSYADDTNLYQLLPRFLYYVFLLLLLRHYAINFF